MLRCCLGAYGCPNHAWMPSLGAGLIRLSQLTSLRQTCPCTACGRHWRQTPLRTLRRRRIDWQRCQRTVGKWLKQHLAQCQDYRPCKPCRRWTPWCSSKGCRSASTESTSIQSPDRKDVRCILRAIFRTPLRRYALARYHLPIPVRELSRSSRFRFGRGSRSCSATIPESSARCSSAPSTYIVPAASSCSSSSCCRVWPSCTAISHIKACAIPTSSPVLLVPRAQWQ